MKLRTCRRRFRKLETQMQIWSGAGKDPAGPTDRHMQKHNTHHELPSLSSSSISRALIKYYPFTTSPPSSPPSPYTRSSPSY